VYATVVGIVFRQNLIAVVQLAVSATRRRVAA
jgi:hypothetical protein